MLTTSACQLTHISRQVKQCIQFIMKLLIKISIPIIALSAVLSAPRKPRLSLADPPPSYYYRNIDNEPGTYSFGYDVFDQDSGNTQFRTEERYPNGTVAGSYGFMDSLGKARRFDYIADEKGYRVKSDASRQQVLNNYITETQRPSTESIVSWTRGSKPNRKKPINKLIAKRKFNTYQPPSSYALY